MPGQKEKDWNQDFPKSFLLTGKDPQEKFCRTWTISKADDTSPTPIAVTDLSDQGERLRICPLFLEYQTSSSPKINSFSEDTLELSYSLNKSIQVNVMFWTPDSHAICGEIILNNQSEKDIKVTLQLILKTGYPRPGAGFSNLTHEGKNMLQGEAGCKKILCFMSGGPSFDSGSENSLVNDILLGASSSKKIRWSIIIDDSIPEGMDRLDELIDLYWKKELSRRKIKLQDRIMITTPDPDWNFALIYSQCQAESILNSFVCHKNNLDNNLIHSQYGLSLFNAIYPLDKKDAMEILKSSFDPEYNRIENFPPPYPIQGELLWQISESFGHDLPLVSEIEKIEASLDTWFDDWDSDKDGVPELPCPGYFNPFSRDDQIPQYLHNQERNPYLESPALCSLLVNEIRRIIDLRERTGLEPIDPYLLEYQAKMVDYIHSSWDKRSGSYQTRDSRSHLVTEEEMIRDDISQGFNILREVLPFPSGIIINISAHQYPSSNNNCIIVIHGKGLDGSSQIERIKKSDFTRMGQIIWAHSKLIYTEIEYLFIQGFGVLHGRILCPGSNKKDISTFFPLLARIPNDSQLVIMKEKHITNTDQYWSPYGIRTSPQARGELVQLPWNFFLLEAFLKYEDNELASRLFFRLMEGMIEKVRSSGCLYPGIDVSTGKGHGEAISAAGLIPVRLLFKLAGLEFNNNSLVGTGDYSLDFPITIQFHGITITRTGKDTVISIPGEKTLRYKGDQEFEVEFP